MNRAGRRKMLKDMKTRLTDEQLKQLQNDANMEYIEKEVQKRLKFSEDLFKESLEEAFKRQNIPSTKAKALLDDVILIIKRKAAEKRNGESKARLS